MNTHLTKHSIFAAAITVSALLALAAGLEKTIEAMGIRVLCNTITTRIARTGSNGTSRLTHLEFKDGSTLDTDMVVVSAGIRPITEIATASALTVTWSVIDGPGTVTFGAPNAAVTSGRSLH